MAATFLGMARLMRVDYPGAIYHLLNRGDRREPTLRDDVDRRLVVGMLDEVCGRSGYQVHASCLMPNRFHLSIETPQPTSVTVAWMAAGLQMGSAAHVNTLLYFWRQGRT